MLVCQPCHTSILTNSAQTGRRVQILLPTYGYIYHNISMLVRETGQHEFIQACFIVFLLAQPSSQADLHEYDEA